MMQLITIALLVGKIKFEDELFLKKYVEFVLFFLLFVCFSLLSTVRKYVN